MSEEHNSIHTSAQLQNTESKWYASWFDSPYYHILYKDRDYAEARLFMDNITAYLNLPEKAKILDLACGKGRHSIYLNEIGFDVTGADLSENSIAEAKKHEREHLHFVVHDMREKCNEQYDAVFNLFTSFGYFDTEEDNARVLRSIRDSLNEFGFGVIDFMNASRVIKNLVPEETKIVEDIEFHIKRYVVDNYIYKEIDFEDKGHQYHFVEKVKAYTSSDFETMMEENGIYLLDMFGDYKLKSFSKNDSERLIMIFK
ncbi:MAG: class I SAM-dependent methyltransferase [Flavobacterium sp.]|nr:class I SAM-dependent methyltransferase [Flavobacterium sp.]